MKLVAPDYYTDFKCIADKCRHSCCVGWEIDIDEKSYERFMKMPGDFGERVRKSITMGEEGPYFHMTNDGKCPFLNEKGLCDMIIAEGEESLCQICADHPRYRNFWSDREEIGLGMCCEAAAMLILGRKEPVKDVILEDDGGNEELSEEEAEILEYRNLLIEMAQDRTKPVKERVNDMLYELGMSENIAYARWAEFLMGLERLDDAWADRLETLFDEYDGASGLDDFETAFEQLLTYLIRRHVPESACDCDVEVCALYVILMWSVMRRMCEVFACEYGKITLPDIAEIARLYSGEIEYSDENIGAVMNEICEKGL